MYHFNLYIGIIQNLFKPIIMNFKKAFKDILSKLSNPGNLYTDSCYHFPTSKLHIWEVATQIFKNHFSGWKFQNPNCTSTFGGPATGRGQHNLVFI